jgi:hypothetical protein
MRSLHSLSWLLLAGVAVAQQPNGASASMTIDGANGPPFPIAANVRTNTTAAFTLSGVPNAPYVVALAAQGVIQPGALVTPGGIVDLPLSPPPVIAVASALDATGSSAFGVVVPPAGNFPAGVPLGHQEALQAAIADPASPVGWRLTAATQVTVIQGPIVVNLNLGSDGAAAIDLAPHGFSIPFYGASYTQLWVCVNGFLTLGAPNTDFTPTATEFNGGPPRIAPFWTDLYQQTGQVRYTIDPNPPGSQAPFVQADWIGVFDWGTQNTHTFSAYADANGLCRLTLSTLNSANTYTTLTGIGPGSDLNPQVPKDLSVLHVAGYAGGTNESFFELFTGPSTWPPWLPSSPFDLYGATLSFFPIAGGGVPAATSAYFLN